jgi:hypothetical protein
MIAPMYDAAPIAAPALSFPMPSAWRIVDEHYEASVAISDLWKRQLEQRLLSLFSDTDDMPVDPLSLEYAMAFLYQLPTEIPAPTIEVENDGEVAFDWHVHSRATFSVSIGPDGTLRYGGLFGADTRYGTEQLSSSLSAEILRNVNATRKYGRQGLTSK